MSPHAVPPSEMGSPYSDNVAYLMQKHAVTSNGFLPAKAPLCRLPDMYYLPWERLANEMPVLLDNGTLRSRVDAMDVLSTEFLRSEPEWRRAFVVLSFLTHAYVWGGQEPAEILPASISVPFLEVAKVLELPPVLAYAGSNLWNFTTSGRDFTDVDSLRCLHTFTGTEDESWFFVISVAMEAQAASIIPSSLAALEAIKTRDYATITSALAEMDACIAKVGALIERMHERCDPDVFYHKIRPFLAGSKNMEAAGLPRGVFYSESATDPEKGEWRQLRGGSNGQSSMIQFFDVVLGVQHTNEGNGRPSPAATPASSSRSSPEPMAASTTAPKPSFHEEVRDYMPGPHRRFLTAASQMGSIHELAVSVGQLASTTTTTTTTTTPEQDAFLAAYKKATQTLTAFRNIHIQIVTRYIILPARRAGQKGTTGAKKDLASASAGESDDNGAPELKGTGGTTLIPFLKQARDETSAAGNV
ncbi:indoleamine 2,3-dioxygenase [Microdochium trichocladiopsis]|uniref:Indoleamine 2,3-dioxygenase n=1 Tax=Microdochium trichocladiopsis TaxID=1682393 RepID=A0A9P8YG98_9PEZI|nr:indoleamine 2,3-dioxygenase [Microdochium trichocladiopsis]KAH7039966.1 indoleamine 2,3-dioxygenase [Microdochium trichocladiopsis]